MTELWPTFLTRLGARPQPAPFWLPDHSSATCHHCEAQFTLLLRRHHCRVCGRIFCGRCTQQTLWLTPPGALQPAPVRACTFCFKLREAHTPRTPSHSAASAPSSPASPPAPSAPAEGAEPSTPNSEPPSPRSEEGEEVVELPPGAEQCAAAAAEAAKIMALFAARKAARDAQAAGRLASSAGPGGGRAARMAEVEASAREAAARRMSA